MEVIVLISNRVNTFLLVLLIVMAGAIIAILASRSTAGPLDPTGPPSSTLPQVEPRIPISQPDSGAGFPIVLSQAGSYFLTGNITAPSAKDGIVIAAQRVTLDLNGFTIAGHSPNSGITDDNLVVRTDIAIRNGVLTGWEDGVRGPFMVRSTFEDLRVTGDASDLNATGLAIGSGNTVRRVTATENKLAGVYITQQGSYYGGSVTDSNLSGNGSGLDLQANNITARHNVMDGNQVGVVIFSNLNWIEDNDITGNTAYGVFFQTGSNLNTVVRNFMPFNQLNPVRDDGTNDHVGVFTATASSSDVWSNISYP